jgi:AcrR family transcriptional regulator
MTAHAPGKTGSIEMAVAAEILAGLEQLGSALSEGEQEVERLRTELYAAVEAAVARSLVNRCLTITAIAQAAGVSRPTVYSISGQTRPSER